MIKYLDLFFGYLAGAILIILGLCALFIALIIYHLNVSYGPASDSKIIAAMAPKFEVTRVFAKDYDEWDGSCMVYVVDISSNASKAIEQEGISFFDIQTRTYSFSENPIVIPPWLPIKKMVDTPHKLESFRWAVNCSDIGSGHKRLARNLLEKKEGYFSWNERSETMYMVFPSAKYLFITHYD